MRKMMQLVVYTLGATCDDLADLFRAAYSNGCNILHLQWQVFDMFDFKSDQFLECQLPHACLKPNREYEVQ